MQNRRRLGIASGVLLLVALGPVGGCRESGDRRPARRAATTGDVGGQVIAIVSEQMGVKVDELKPETSLQEDLKADDLDMVELVMECEDRFDISIPDAEFEKVRTVRQLVDLAKAKVAPPTADSPAK